VRLRSLKCKIEKIGKKSYHAKTLISDNSPSSDYKDSKLVFLNPNRAESSWTEPIESIQLGFGLEADSVWLDLRISSHDLVRLEPQLVDETDGADVMIDNLWLRQIGYQLLARKKRLKKKTKEKKKTSHLPIQLIQVQAPMCLIYYALSSFSRLKKWTPKREV
jgi:hypothetical protein